jgi:hypothetical protein
MSLCRLFDLRREIVGSPIEDHVGTQFSSSREFVRA